MTTMNFKEICCGRYGKAENFLFNNLPGNSLEEFSQNKNFF